MFTLRINTGNAAFKPLPQTEIRWILCQLAKKMDSSWINSVPISVYDRNGNKVGTATLTSEE